MPKPLPPRGRGGNNLTTSSKSNLPMKLSILYDHLQCKQGFIRNSNCSSETNSKNSSLPRSDLAGCSTITSSETNRSDMSSETDDLRRSPQSLAIGGKEIGEENLDDDGALAKDMSAENFSTSVYSPREFMQLKDLCFKFNQLIVKVQEEVQAKIHAEKKVQKLEEILKGGKIELETRQCQSEYEKNIVDLKHKLSTVYQELAREKEKCSAIVMELQQLQREQVSSDPCSCSIVHEIEQNAIHEALISTINETQAILKKKQHEIDHLSSKFHAEKESRELKQQKLEKVERKYQEALNELSHQKELYGRVQEEKKIVYEEFQKEKIEMQNRLETITELNKTMEKHYSALLEQYKQQQTRLSELTSEREQSKTMGTHYLVLLEQSKQQEKRLNELTSERDKWSHLKQKNVEMEECLNCYEDRMMDVVKDLGQNLQEAQCKINQVRREIKEHHQKQKNLENSLIFTLNNQHHQQNHHQQDHPHHNHPHPHYPIIPLYPNQETSKEIQQQFSVQNTSPSSSTKKANNHSKIIENSKNSISFVEMDDSLAVQINNPHVDETHSLPDFPDSPSDQKNSLANQTDSLPDSPPDQTDSLGNVNHNASTANDETTNESISINDRIYRLFHGLNEESRLVALEALRKTLVDVVEETPTLDTPIQEIHHT